LRNFCSTDHEKLEKKMTDLMTFLFYFIAQKLMFRNLMKLRQKIHRRKKKTEEKNKFNPLVTIQFVAPLEFHECVKAEGSKIGISLAGNR
jgi:hypothetical protein